MNQMYGGECLIEESVYGEIRGRAVQLELDNLEKGKDEENSGKEEDRYLWFEDLDEKKREGQNNEDTNTVINEKNYDILKVLDRMSNALEKFSIEIIKSDNVKENEDISIIRLLETIKNVTVDDTTALKVHNMGITDNLLNLLLVVDKFSDHFASLIASTLVHLTKFSKALKKVENDIEFIDPIVFFFSFLLD